MTHLVENSENIEIEKIVIKRLKTFEREEAISHEEMVSYFREDRKTLIRKILLKFFA